MNCMCCGRALGPEETKNSWHRACVRRFFGTGELPHIAIDDQTLEALAQRSTSQGLTVPGVQKKLSLQLISDKKDARLTLVNHPTGYILKPQVEEFEALPESEHLVMAMADLAGIKTVPHALIRQNGRLAYITKRVDRIGEGSSVRMLAMEDFCQLDLRLTRDKYRGSYERCAKVIERYSSFKKLALTELYLRLVFSFLVGNSDMHLKNFSLLESEKHQGVYHLSPAYDLLPVNVIMTEDTEEFALTMNGKKRNIGRSDFLVFAGRCGIPENSALKMMEKVLEMSPIFIEMSRKSLLPLPLSESLISLIKKRAGILSDASG